MSPARSTQIKPKINKNSKKIAEKKVMERVKAFDGKYADYLNHMGKEKCKKIEEQKTK